MAKFTHRPFCDDDDKFIRANYGVLTNSDISQRMERNFIAIRQRAVKLGLEQPNQRRKKKQTENPVVLAIESKHDAEIDAIRTCVKALVNLDKEQIQRVLRYCYSVYNIDWISALEPTA